MKKFILTMALALLIIPLAFAGGKAQSEDSVTINFARQGPEWQADRVGKWSYWTGGFFEHTMKQFEKETGIKVVIDHIPEGGDTVVAIDSRLASSDPYDVVFLYGGKAPKYGTERYAINLRDYLKKDFFEKFRDDTLVLFNANPEKTVYLVPSTAWVVGGMINYDIAKAANFEVPGIEWTLEDFETFCEAVKKNVPDKYGAHINGSGGYDMLGWFAAFGANIWNRGKLQVATPEARRALMYLKKIQDNEWCVPDPAAQGWGTQIQNAFSGLMGFYSGTIGWMGYGKIGVEKGLIDKPYDARRIEYPTVPGVESRPLMLGPDAFVAFDNKIVYGDKVGEAKAKASAALVEWMSVGETHDVYQKMLRMSPLKSPVVLKSSDYDEAIWRDYEQVLGVALKNGYYDQAMGSPYYGSIRKHLGAAMQAVFNGEKSPEEALSDAESAILEDLRY